MATIQLKKHQQDEALQSLEQSIHYRSALVAAHPSVIRFHEKLGESYQVIADLELAMHQNDKAFSSACQARDVFERLVKSEPDQVRFHHDLGMSCTTLGVIHDEARDNQKAITAFGRAVAEHERSGAASQDVRNYKVYLSLGLENLGEQYVDLGRFDEGLPYYLKALRIRQDLHLARPKNLGYALDLAKATAQVGAVERHAGHAGAAAAIHPGARIARTACGRPLR